MIRLVLPWPPTVNTYWRHIGRRTILSRRAREYKKLVAHCVALEHAGKRWQGRLEMWVKLVPPNRRQIDVDNRLKAVLDSLQYAGVYEDDSQIYRLHVLKEEPIKGAGGVASVTIARIDRANEVKHGTAGNGAGTK